MNRYLITVKTHGGPVMQMLGIFAGQWDAVLAALETFSDASVITARRLA